MSKIVEDAARYRDMVSPRIRRPGGDRIRRDLRVLLAVPVLIVGLGFAMLVVGPTELAAQKGKTVPGYVLQTLAIPSGFTRAYVLSISDNHEMVGIVGPYGSPRAVYWASADAYPVLLPCPAPPCSASGINASGVISGTANFQAVHWRFDGYEWVVQPLPYPGLGDPAYRSSAGGLLDDGTTAGAYQYYYGVRFPNDIPVRFTSGTWFEYPVPPGFFAGRAYRVNENEDAVGELKQNDGQDPTYVYGVIWRKEGATYRTEVRPWAVGGITPRFADGSFLAASAEGRIRVPPSGAPYVEASVDGPALGINRLGDTVGYLYRKGGYNAYAGSPYLLMLDGTLIKLPLPTGATGEAACVSTDRWVAGDYLRQGVYYPAVWKPQ